MSQHSQNSFAHFLILGAMMMFISLSFILHLGEARQVVIESTSSYDDDQRARISHCIHYPNKDECRGEVQRIPASGGRGGSTANNADQVEELLESTTPISATSPSSKQFRDGTTSSSSSIPAHNESKVHQNPTSTQPVVSTTTKPLSASSEHKFFQLKNTTAISTTTIWPKEGFQTAENDHFQLRNSTASSLPENGENLAKSVFNSSSAAADDHHYHHHQKQKKLRTELLPPMSQLPHDNNTTHA